MYGLIEVKLRNNLGRNLGSSRKETLSLRKMVKGGLTIKAPNLPTLLTDVMATRKKAFMERIDSEHEAIVQKVGGHS